MSILVYDPLLPPGGIADDRAEVATMEMRLLVGDHIGLDVAEGGVGLVPDAFIEGLDDVFLEGRRPREGLHHHFTLLIGILRVGARLFRQEVGITPSAWVEAIRVEAAQSLLEAGAAPKLVADQCGFSDVDTFRRAFQRKIGVTPAAYRRVQVDEPQATP